jgi:hypothetical protein
MDAEGYLAAIKAKLVNSAIVGHIDIVREYFTRDQGFFRARLTLQNIDFLWLLKPLSARPLHYGRTRITWESGLRGGGGGTSAG